MAFDEQKVSTILQFLRDNPQLSSYESSAALFDLGVTVSYRIISEYRRRFGIDFDGRVSLANKIKADIETGVEVTADYVVNKYKCSRSHANKSIKEAKGIKPQRKKNKVVVAAEQKVIEPLPVTSMAFYVQQLTANDASYKGAA